MKTETKKETLNRRFDGKILSLIEHLIIGSTPTVNGELIKVFPLLERAVRGDYEAHIALLTPIHLQQGTKNVFDINRERASMRPGREMTGILGILEAERQMKLAIQGINVYLEPGEINERSKTSSGVWKIWLVGQDGEQITGDGFWHYLSLVSKFKPFFSLETPKPGQNFGLLKVELNGANGF